MSVRLASSRGGARGSGAGLRGAKERLVSTIREVAREVAEHASRVGEREREFYREIPELNAYVVAWSPSNEASVNFKDMLVDEDTGRLKEERVASVYVVADSFEPKVELTTIHKPPVSWQPPQSLALLPAAFNTALSAFKVGRVLSRRLGLRLEVKGVAVRHMYSADDSKRRPVVLVDFDVNGRRFTLGRLEVKLERENYEAVRKATLNFDVLLRHRDRKLARRLYVLSWLDRELGDALRRLSEEKGYSYREVTTLFSGEPWLYYTYEVDLGDKKVEITRPHLTSVTYFDEEYLLSKVWETYEPRRDELNLVEKLAERVNSELEDIERESSEMITGLINDAKRLLDSKDPREKDLGFLLAVLIKRAYEEAEMTIPG